MPEFQPVSDVADACLLDEHEVSLGYRCGLANTPAPGSWASRAFWHGWRNGRVDGGHTEPDATQDLLSYRWQVSFGFAPSPSYH